MITRNATAFIAAIFLVTISSQTANAKLNEFCDAKYCGQYTPEVSYRKKITHRKHYSKPYKQARKASHKKLKPKPVQVASLGENPTSEHPTATGLLQEAGKYLGGNPTGWRSLWCARFIAMIAPSAADRLKRMGLNPNWARDYAKLPGAKKVGGAVGDIVVLTRGRGGHIGVLKKFDKNGNPIIISGNHGRKVGEGLYSKSRVIAYVTI